jgi:hypothetical protein
MDNLLKRAPIISDTPRRHECVSLGLDQNPLLREEENQPSYGNESSTPVIPWQGLNFLEASCVLGYIIEVVEVRKGD